MTAEAWAEARRLHTELHSLDMTLRYGDWKRCPMCSSYRDNALNVTPQPRTTDANRKARP